MRYLNVVAIIFVLIMFIVAIVVEEILVTFMFAMLIAFLFLSTFLQMIYNQLESISMYVRDQAEVQIGMSENRPENQIRVKRKTPDMPTSGTESGNNSGNKR